jgi:hypothetical protein
MKRRHQRLFKLLLFVLAGAIINVAVAWGCAVFVKFPRDGRTLKYGNDEFGDPFVATTRRGFGHLRESRLPGRLKEGLTAPRRYEERVDFEWLDSGRRGCTIFVGWPMLALTCRNDREMVMLHFPGADGLAADGDPSGSLIGGIPLPPGPDSGPWDMWRALPYTPIYAGFAINTIFYAAIVWVLFAVPGVVRRRVRRKRGQCAACGYSLRGTPDIEKCPECGATV